MKVTIVYNMDNEEDRIKYARAMKATKYHIALYELANLFRNADKYSTFAGTNLTSDTEQCLMHEVNRQFWSICQENGIDPYGEE